MRLIGGGSVRSLARLAGAALLIWGGGAAAQTTCPGWAPGTGPGADCAPSPAAAASPNGFETTPGWAPEAPAKAPVPEARRRDPGSDGASAGVPAAIAPTSKLPNYLSPSYASPTYGDTPSINPRMEAPAGAFPAPATAPRD